MSSSFLFFAGWKKRNLYRLAMNIHEKKTKKTRKQKVHLPVALNPGVFWPSLSSWAHKKWTLKTESLVTLLQHPAISWRWLQLCTEWVLLASTAVRKLNTPLIERVHSDLWWSIFNYLGRMCQILGMRHMLSGFPERIREAVEDCMYNCLIWHPSWAQSVISKLNWKTGAELCLFWCKKKTNKQTNKKPGAQKKRENAQIDGVNQKEMATNCKKGEKSRHPHLPKTLHGNRKNPEE